MNTDAELDPIYKCWFNFVDLHGTASAFTNAGEIWFEDVSRYATILDQCSCSFGSKPDRLESWSSGNLVDMFIFVTALLPEIIWTMNMCEVQPWTECHIQCP